MTISALASHPTIITEVVLVVVVEVVLVVVVEVVLVVVVEVVVVVAGHGGASSTVPFISNLTSTILVPAANP